MLVSWLSSLTGHVHQSTIPTLPRKFNETAKPVHVEIKLKLNSEMVMELIDSQA
ncbi:hypothetical protein Spico_0241 [Parasphaerochaeta coccoides DSM 17374]|uniref:Uncharacterized protein n=1 Tax=Parasphaerochaeta coccoides (strain ATCC BAA-1237 / DSM 17374 / SPN1) TaxID=760011 RepID=F4GKR6_PARC1|nr:hypothetical protein Spico_0241 [Parasphaerochaeta coccoides DSM 17374]